MRFKPRLLVLLGLGLIAGLAADSQPEEPPGDEQDTSSPNVVLITVDTLRADHLSSYGYHLKTSPNIDQLAEEGVRFERTYTVIPLTGPAHLSMFTSRYPQEHGARINGIAIPRDSRWLSLPQILRRFGYASAAFVSAWPLIDRMTELGRWFDVYNQKMTRKYEVFHSSRYAQDVTPEAIRWLNGNQKKPFFLWVHYFDPHSPYNRREAFASPRPSGHPRSIPEPKNEQMRDRVERYDSEIGYADHHIGLLLKQLDRLRLRDTTLVVLTADHGESLGENGYVGHGRRLSEGIIRIPLIMRYPGSIPPRTVVNERVSLLDITPTIIDLSGIGRRVKDPPWSFAGRSLAAAWRDGEKLPARPMRYVAFAGRKGIAPAWVSWMWVRRPKLPLRIGKTEGTQKVVWTPESNSLDVIDLKADPYESSPLRLKVKNNEYRRHTNALRRWYDATDLEEGDSSLSGRDTEILKSLGYIQ